MVEAEVLLGVDDAVKVRFHEIRHDVDILELLGGRWDQDVHDTYDLNERQSRTYRRFKMYQTVVRT